MSDEKKNEESEKDTPTNTDQIGSLDTTTDGGGQSAASTSGVFAEADDYFANTDVPEGIAYGLLPDPEATGDDALTPKYKDYADEYDSPRQQALRDNFAPGSHPDQLAARAELANEDGFVEEKDVEKHLKKKQEERKRIEEEQERAARPGRDEPHPEGGLVVDGTDDLADGAHPGDNLKEPGDGGVDENGVPNKDKVSAIEDVEAENKKAEETGVKKDQFDPNEHTVAEVNDYLENASDEEKERVLKAEKKSDNPRKGVVDNA